MSENFCSIGSQTHTYTIKGNQNSYSVDQALVYVIEVDNKMAEQIGVDLVSLATAAVDAAGIVLIKNSLGISGRAYLKHHGGKDYLILKGNPLQRPNLRGTRYLSTNPKVAHITVGGKSIARGIGRLSGIVFIAYTTLNVIEHLMSADDRRLSSLLGNIAADITKFFISAGAGFLVALAVGSLTTLVAGPLIAAVFVGVATSIVLDRLDRNFALTEKLILAIEKIQTEVERPFSRLAREIAAWERWLIDDAIRKSIRY